jgi:hypothetical protein
MTHPTTTKEIISEFDAKFGIDGDGRAGCDGCFANETVRENHKNFLTSKLESRVKEIIEIINENENGEDANILLVAKLKATLTSTYL